MEEKDIGLPLNAIFSPLPSAVYSTVLQVASLVPHHHRAPPVICARAREATGDEVSERTARNVLWKIAEHAPALGEMRHGAGQTPAALKVLQGSCPTATAVAVPAWNRPCVHCGRTLAAGEEVDRAGQSNAL